MEVLTTEDSGLSVEEPAPKHCPQSALYFLLFTIVDCPLVVTGLAGNILSVKILSKEKISATIFLLKCLAIADISLLVSILPLTCSFAMDYLGLKTARLFSDTKMISTAYLQPLVINCHMTTTWITVIVAWQRYLAVCKPLSNQKPSLRRTKIQIACLILFVLLFNIPRFLEAKVFRNNGQIVLAFNSILKDPVYNYLYKVVLYNSIMYAVPVISLVYFTAKLIKALNEAKKKRQAMMSQQASNSPREDLTLSLIVVVIVFIICQLFNPIRRIIAAIQEESVFACGKPYYLIIPITAFAMILNSSANFVIYTLCVPRFRLNLKGMCRKFGATVEPTGGSADSGHNTASTGI